MKKIFVFLFSIATIVASCSAKDFTMSKLNYRNWADSVKLENNNIELIIVPEIARIMHISLKGMPNIFWHDESLIGQDADPDSNTTGKYKNFGGSKLWVAPQAIWGTVWQTWPPHYALDSAPCSVRVSSGHISLKGQTSSLAGVKFNKNISISSNKVILEYIMENTSDKPIEWGIWMVAQFKPAGMAFLPLPEETKLWSKEEDKQVPPDYNWKKINDVYVLKHAESKDGAKIFAISSEGWMAYIVEGQVIYITYEADPTLTYPEGEGNSEIFTCKDYIELEHIGQLEKLTPGRKAALKESWHIFKAPSADLNTEELADWVLQKAGGIRFHTN